LEDETLGRELKRIYLLNPTPCASGAPQLSKTRRIAFIFHIFPVALGISWKSRMVLLKMGI
jgi:hypothetical protein